jgi:hypothetical protein
LPTARFGTREAPCGAAIPSAVWASSAAGRDPPPKLLRSPRACDLVEMVGDEGCTEGSRHGCFRRTSSMPCDGTFGAHWIGHFGKCPRPGGTRSIGRGPSWWLGGLAMGVGGLIMAAILALVPASVASQRTQFRPLVDLQRYCCCCHSGSNSSGFGHL